MSKRVTIIIDNDVEKKIRILQSKEIAKSVKNVSFSSVVNDILRKGLK